VRRPRLSTWCVYCFATARGAPGWFCPSDLRRVVPALSWLSYAGEWPPRQCKRCAPASLTHLRPPASKAGALSAELLGAGRASESRTPPAGVKSPRPAPRRTPQGKLRAENPAVILRFHLSAFCFQLFLLAPRRSSALRPQRYELRVPLPTPARYVVTRAGSAPATSPL
jgi:hypothetical protein